MLRTLELVLAFGYVIGGILLYLRLKKQGNS
jgi:hypothetical protein